MIERKDKHYSIEEVFSFFEEHLDKKEPKKRVEFDGDMMKPYSVRYFTFMQKGTHSKKPSNYNPDENYHFNLYAVNDDGEEVLMTKDHVIPHAKGGSNGVSNMVTMCTHCNCEKGKTLPKTWQKEHPEAEQLPKGVLKPDRVHQINSKQHTSSFVAGFECGVNSMKLYMNDYLKFLKEENDTEYSMFIESVQFIIDNSEEKMLEIATNRKKGNTDGNPTTSR